MSEVAQPECVEVLSCWTVVEGQRLVSRFCMYLSSEIDGSSVDDRSELMAVFWDIYVLYL